MEYFSFSIIRRLFTILIILCLSIPLSIKAENTIKDTMADYPRWRGFNLLEKFHKSWINKPFVEEDFKWIKEFGFNFVRLPMDYRVWIKDNDWTKFNEDVLKEIDQAVEWGRKYGLHVSINFHRGPGYSVATPKEAKSLWTSPEAQKAFVLHWETFAKRYKGIPGKELSFNLLNEPHGNREAYIKVAKMTIEAIRKIDPKRLIISDGDNYCSEPLKELLPYNIIQAARGYQPFQLTHYKASWANGSDTWPVPTWPVYKALNNYIYGPIKQEYQTPLVIKGDFKNESYLKIKINKVSKSSKLVIRADGKQVFEKLFQPGPGEGEWKQAVYEAQWDIYQNVYDKYYEAKIPAKTKEISIENTEGDWLTFSELQIGPSYGNVNKEITIPVESWDWGMPQKSYNLTISGKLEPLSKEAGNIQDKKWHWETQVKPWIDLEAKGAFVIVGEWGSYRYTSHDVVLRWMKDCLGNWKKAGFGWALWNFRGDFGILDSNRSDVQYEDFRGHKLDRAMLNLLQQY